jgi:GT2 family glycosyltransferase
MLSAVITNYNPDEPLLVDCFKSLQGKVDETIIISSKKSWLGEKINQGMRMAKGDYILILNDDAVYQSGDLSDLCVKSAITCPKINGNQIPFHAHVFCVPREIFEVTGGYDETYEQAYYDDNDFWANVESKGFRRQPIDSVDFSHPPQGGNTLHKIDNMNVWRETNRRKFNEKWGRNL